MHRSIFRSLFSCVLCCTVAFAAATLHGGETAGSTTTLDARNEAIRSIPLRKIAPRYRQMIETVLNDCSLYRRLPTMTVDCHPALFTYQAQNPDVLVQIWRQLDISNVDLVKSGDNRFRMSDNVGTTGELVIVEQKCDAQAQNRVVMYAQGQYDGAPFKKPVRAECVLLLRSGSVTETNGRDYVAARFDTFVRIDRASLELFAKAVHPLVGRTADRNFVDTMNFISSMSLAAETRPATIARLANSLPKISGNRKQQLVRLAYECAESHRKGEDSDERLAHRSK